MINLSEFHSYIADNQPNICQVTVIQNGKTIINDIWNGYKADDINEEKRQFKKSH